MLGESLDGFNYSFELIHLISAPPLSLVRDKNTYRKEANENGTWGTFLILGHQLFKRLSLLLRDQCHISDK